MGNDVNAYPSTPVLLRLPVLSGRCSILTGKSTGIGVNIDGEGED